MGKHLKSKFSYLLFAAPILYTANGIRLHIKDLNVSNYSLSELLINYQGGFVRRGLLGEIAFNSNDPVQTITVIQKSALVLVLVGLLAILAAEKSNVVRMIFTTAIIFAPGGLHDMKLGGSSVSGYFEYLDRKEIWFYLALICFYVITRFFSERYFIFYGLFSLVSIFTVLIHELFIIFPLAILTTFIISKKIAFRSSEFAAICVSYFAILATLMLVTINHGDENISKLISQSYAQKFPNLDVDGVLTPTENAIFAIGWPISRSQELASRLFLEGSVIYYIYFLALALLTLLVFTVIKFEKQAQLIISLLLTFAILTGLSSIVFVFLDAGRLISMLVIGALISLYVLAEYLKQAEVKDEFRFQNWNSVSPIRQRNLIMLAVAGYLFFVGAITRVEHSNPQPNQIPLKSFLGLIE